jgi:hypothetical protein
MRPFESAAAIAIKLQIMFVTVAANINDSEYYDYKGDDNQQSDFRVYVVPNVVLNKRDEKMAVCFQNVADQRV